MTLRLIPVGYSKYLRHTFDTFKRRTTGAIIIGSCADLLLYAGSNYLNIRILKLDGRYTFVPIAVETFGPLNREGLDFLSETSVATPKKLKTQDWAIKNPRKPKVKILYVFGKFLEKIALFLKKQTFPEKMSFYPPKFSDDLFFFLVIASDFQIFYPDFSNFEHF